MGTQKAQVHLLPAQNTSTLYKGQIWTHSNGGIKSVRIWKSPDTHVVDEELRGYCVPQHLYFTTDEEIKEGDWIMRAFDKAILRDNVNSDNRKGEKFWKIVASDDGNLWTVHSLHTFKNPRTEQVFDLPLYSSEGVSKIDDSFIEAYIEAYRRGKSIEEVLLVTESVRHSSGLYYDSMQEKLKLRGNGTVIIKPITERTYHKEQVIRMLVGWKSTEVDVTKRAEEAERYIDDYYPD
jgi:hypothetical protein